MEEGSAQEEAPGKGKGQEGKIVEKLYLYLFLHCTIYM